MEVFPQMAWIAAVSVENTSFSFDRTYSYLMPETEKAAPGCRVLVPFGRGNRIRTGIVCSVEEGTPSPRLKKIHRVLDAEPILSPLQMKLCSFLAEQTLSSLYSVQNLCIPAGLKFRRRAVYKAVSDAEPEGTRSREIMAFVRSAKTGRTDRAMEEHGYDEQDPDLLGLLSEGFLVRTGDYVRKLGDAGVKMVRLLGIPDDSCRYVTLPETGSLPLTEKQHQVVELLSQQSANLKEICYLTGVTSSVVDRLADKGIVEYDEVEVYRNPYAGAEAEKEASDLNLNREQQKAFDRLNALACSGEPKAALLFGVTGSGKTAVFFKLMEETLRRGRNVLFLVPEIALTAQTVRRLHLYFGSEVAVMHSALSVGQRMDEWKRIQRGEARIVMGTRSAVFAPLSDIGLIVMDEEQESAYKSDREPRFHARLAAKYLAADQKALLVMASATPSIESYYAAQQGKYTLCSLPNRYNQCALPEAQIVDMANEPGRGSERLSQPLLLETAEALSRGEQVIILCNRRGYETTATCKACHKTAECPNCSVSLTYHKANGRLMCHYCGYSRPADSPCDFCGGEVMAYTGVGTQKITEMLQSCFPDARILRMDADTTMTKNAHEKGFEAFANREYDILVGTQMVAKGLDFPAVTLVGVLGADKAVYSGDFRGSQRAFNLITQVVGRSGRGEKPGKAIIQTLDPDSEPIVLACRQDYLTFYQEEIAVRKLLLYPPFCDLCAVGFLAAEEDALMQGGKDFLLLLTSLARSEYADLPIRALGPSSAPVYRAMGFYRSRLLLKCRNSRRFRELMRRTLTEFERTHPACRVVADTTGELDF